MAANQESFGTKRVRNDTHFSLNQENKKADEKSNGGLESFANDTTLHGARFLCDKNIFRRVLWTLVLIGSFSYCIFQVYETLVAFSERPFITKVSTSTTETNESFFPAVSLCNLNAFNTRRYRNALKYHQFSEPLIEKKIQDMLVIVNKDKKAFNDEFVKRNPEFFRRQKTANSRIVARSNLSHQIEEMLLPVSPQFHSCSVNGKKCTANNFTSHMSSEYGLCYTFNSVKSGRPLLHATLSGKNSGLRLLLNIERDSYLITNIRPTVGLAIIIHDQKSFPFMEDFGTTVQPGISTLCAFRKRKIVNLKGGILCLTCLSSDLYKLSLQIRMCFSRTYYFTALHYTVKRCGCTPTEFKEEFGASSEKESCDKNCPEPCEHVEYETSFSYSALQPESFVDHLMDFLKSNDTSVDRAIYEPLLNMTPSERERYIEKNIISLDIYFEDLSYEIIEQTPVYETWTMIGSLGGTFGLFLGMSLLTILEFLDFIFARICHLLQGLHSGNRHTGTIHAEF
ncbi:unnamed protein product [Porites evermanni]|uniref:Uncharacterized protein n=1 Tax=Porites evermanni TaxID=104178 RepID=A0ABN8LJ54_9CNID|nr:unnamed protein product [Porites evermanni]